jgi:hypothetical protein
MPEKKGIGVRIFTGKRLTYVEVAAIAKEDILQRAFNTYVPAIPAEPH